MQSTLEPSDNADMPRLGTKRKGVWAYFSLVFSVFYFLPLYFATSYNWSTVSLIIFIYIGFISSYVIALRVSANQRIFALSCVTLVCFIALYFNIGALVLFGYCVFAIGYYWPLKISVSTSITLLFFVLVGALLMSNITWQYALPFLISNMGLFCFGAMERRETLHQIRLTRSQEAVQQLSTIAERERIGRDLHDIAGHALSSISLKAQLALKLLEKEHTSKAKEELVQLADLSQNLLSEIRKAVSDIKSLSMQEEIQKVEDLLLKKNILLVKHIDHKVVQNLNSIQESNLSLIMKESLINVIRHSDANKVELSLTQVGQDISLSIKDNGSKHILEGIEIGNGIRGMQERASILGGKLLTNLKEEFEILVVIPKENRA